MTRSEIFTMWVETFIHIWQPERDGIRDDTVLPAELTVTAAGTFMQGAIS